MSWYDDRVAQEVDGKVWACPICGRRVLSHCHHDGADYKAELFSSAYAQALREESDMYEPHLFECRECKCEREIGPGCLIGSGGITCADCAGPA